MAIHILNRLLSSITSYSTKSQSRSLFYWVRDMFNRVEEDRILVLGPDVACAMWLLRNGAYVRWKGYSEHLIDYNKIPEDASYYIEAVHADNAGINHVGFPYFGCKHIKEMNLISCKYINNQAMALLPLLKDSLTEINIIKCKSVTDEGLLCLKDLKNLKLIKVEGLRYLEDKESVRNELKNALPDCEICIK
ncbi:ATP synthase subunit s, mitochondrial isoform X2 [Nomia melanderi]|uniref:ATP synthase subunit s, mitochondrial isoform X2 n=1 Tax=Nomia melanderi TaxID=2448451 RepID=UPI003FCECD83